MTQPLIINQYSKKKVKVGNRRYKARGIVEGLDMTTMTAAAAAAICFLIMLLTNINIYVNHWIFKINYRG